MIYLVSYRPLLGHVRGRESIARYRLPPFVDGSCRRDNDPLPLDMTIRCSCLDHVEGRPDSVEEWDQKYRERAQRYGAFLVCRTLFNELHRPPILTEAAAREVFGPMGMPSTQTPPAID